MVYEYCKEIQESGINRNILKNSSFNSFMEAGLEVALNTTKEVNKLFEQVGTIELAKYRVNTLTEADEGEIKKTFLQRFIDRLVKLWEGIKGIWQKIRDFFYQKYLEFAKKVVPAFDKLELGKYKKVCDSIMKSANVSDDILHILGSQGIAHAEEKIISASEALKSELTTDKKQNIEYYLENGGTIGAAFNTLIYKAFPNGNSVLKNKEGLKAEQAKELVIKELEDNTSKVANGAWLISNKAGIVTAITDNSKKSINNAYKAAKKNFDDAIKAVKNFKANDPNISFVAKSEVNLTVASQTLLLGLADYRKSLFNKILGIATKCVVLCRSGKEDEQPVKQESVKYDTEFVNEVFNW